MTAVWSFQPYGAMTTLRLLTVAQVADILQVHRQRVTDLIAGGDLSAMNIGSEKLHGARYRIDPKDLDRYLMSRR